MNQKPEDHARRAALLALLALALAACGRKGDPLPPEGADPAAPRRYPTR
jgi:predicted small lipoprotein YifL